MDEILNRIVADVIGELGKRVKHMILISLIM